MPAGRPTGYRKEHCQQAIDMGAQGMSKTEIAFNLGISRATLYNRMESHPEFFDAIKQSEDAAAAWFHKKFREIGIGEVEKANIVSMIFLSKNQLPDDFRDRKEHKIEAEIGLFEIDYTGYDEEAS